MTMRDVEHLLSSIYSGITGRPCKASYFVVRKHSAFGFYYVHLLGTGFFYEAKWKVEG